MRSSRNPTFPAVLSEAATLVEARVFALLEREAQRWSDIATELEAPIDTLRGFVASGGKRLRPACCVCGAMAAGMLDISPAVIDAAAAVELIHTFALIHDDVIDGSDVRRSQPAVHRTYAAIHARDDLRGDARRFGDGMAILIGDVALVYADMLTRHLTETAATIYDELRVELCVGQALDVLGAAAGRPTLREARRIATYKSGKYTVERPLQLGAAIVGDNLELGAVLSSIGLPLGEAFQLRDDLLGAFGEESVTGKPVGDDLREGKPTPLLAIAYGLVDSDQRATLDRVGAADLDADAIVAIQRVLIKSGAVARIEAMIAELVTEANAALEVAPIPSDAAAVMRDLADYLAWRDH